MEKAYKLLALQEGISNRAAKELIDRGVVYSEGKKVNVARGEMSGGAKFKVEKIAPIRVIFEDAFIMAVDKPAFMTSEEVAEQKKLPLFPRLDRETSGVLLLTKDEAFRAKAVSAFKKREVKKEYIAIVEGRVVEAVEINAPILTIKKGNTAHSKISDDGKEAISHIDHYSSGHSEAILTNRYDHSKQFLDEVDSAAVYVNASTRFSDGGEFGFGAEIGISTQKLHARGPMGLKALTTNKYIVYGNGQIRK